SAGSVPSEPLLKVSVNGQKIVAVAAGDGHTAAITDSGELWTWGGNGDSQLGVGDTKDRHAPVKVSVNGQKIVAIAAGTYHTAAVTDSGELWTWGSRNFGQLGAGDTMESPLPVKAAAPPSLNGGGVVSDEQRLRELEQKKREFKERQVRGARGLLNRQAAARQREVALDCFWSWHGVVRERKSEDDLATKLQDFRARLRRMKESQAMKADSFFLKASTYSESALMHSCFQAFAAARREVAEEAACRAQLQKSQQEIEKFQQSKSSTAKRIIREMCCCTEMGLVTEAWAAWVMSHGQALEERALQQQLDEGASRRELIRRRSKESGHKVAEKLRAQRDVTALLEVLAAWRIHSRVEGKTRHHRVRVDAKRQQLQGVQTMFRSFATQLEYQLTQSQPSQKEGRLYKSRSVELGLSDTPYRPVPGRRPGRPRGDGSTAGLQSASRGDS
ncbi:RCBTB2, partial [Symbiodinium sp. KB8]